jgi:hypothetical protein
MVRDDMRDKQAEFRQQSIARSSQPFRRFSVGRRFAQEIGAPRAAASILDLHPKLTEQGIQFLRVANVDRPMPVTGQIDSRAKRLQVSDPINPAEPDTRATLMADLNET